MQDNIIIADGAITGTLTKLTSGALVNKWGAGYFLALAATNIDSDTLYTTVCMNPTVSSGPVALDPDGLFVLKVTDKDAQVVNVTQHGLFNTLVQEFDVSGLTLAT